MPRMARFELPGSLYHVMAHSIEGKNLFVDDDDRLNFLSRFEKKLTEIGFKCYAWTLMENHYHLLIRTNDYPLSKLMRGLNSGYARYYNKKYKRRGYLFQDRFKSVICQDQQYAVELIKYIHLNPLRAGKVDSLQQLENWAWCGHGYLLGNENNPGNNFQNRLDSLRYFGENPNDAVKGYLKFMAKSCDCDDNKKAGVLQYIEEMEIKGSCKGWRAVIGDHEFVKKVMEKYKQDLNRRHRKADYPKAMETISEDVCTEFGISLEELLKRGRENERSWARIAFCYRCHVVELIPLSVIARYLGITISPVAAMIKKYSTCVIKESVKSGC